MALRFWESRRTPTHLEQESEAKYSPNPMRLMAPGAVPKTAPCEESVLVLASNMWNRTFPDKERI